MARHTLIQGPNPLRIGRMATKIGVGLSGKVINTFIPLRKKEIEYTAHFLSHAHSSCVLGRKHFCISNYGFSPHFTLSPHPTASYQTGNHVKEPCCLDPASPYAHPTPHTPTAPESPFSPTQPSAFVHASHIIRHKSFYIQRLHYCFLSLVCGV